MAAAPTTMSRKRDTDRNTLKHHPSRLRVWSLLCNMQAGHCTAGGSYKPHSLRLTWQTPALEAETTL